MQRDWETNRVEEIEEPVWLGNREGRKHQALSRRKAGEENNKVQYNTGPRSDIFIATASLTQIRLQVGKGSDTGRTEGNDQSCKAGEILQDAT